MPDYSLPPDPPEDYDGDQYEYEPPEDFDCGICGDPLPGSRMNRRVCEKCEGSFR